MMTQAKLIFFRSFGIIIYIGFLFGCTSLEVKDGTWADAEEQPAPSTDTTTAIEDNSGQIELIEITDTGRLSGLQFEQSAVDKITPEKEELLLYAVSAYLDEQNLQRASQLLEQTNREQLPQLLYLRQQALFASLYMKQNKIQQSTQIIENLQDHESDDPVFIDWLQLLQAQLEIDEKDFLASLKLLNRQTSSDNTIVQAKQNQAVWLFIRRQTIETLEQARLTTSDTNLLGWIELGIIEKKRGQISNNLWQQSIELWASAYREHPAFLIHEQLSASPAPINLDISEFQSNTRIALLLPISSAYGDIATTIRDGFLAAGDVQGTAVSVYDTGSGTEQIIPKYQQALLSGAQIIVGPLGSAAVNHLASTSEIVRPTILLGSITSTTPATDNPTADIPTADNSANIFSFSLDPEHEARSLAEKVYSRGYTRIGILYPDSNRGKRLNSAFAQIWRRLGGTVEASIVYSNDLYEAGEPIERLFDSGGSSADAIFLASNAQQGRLLSQAITKRLPDIAIFATSSIYSGEPEPTRDFVLNNVIFSDMPWMIEGFSQVQFLKQRLTADNETSSNSLSRYFAFGVDAYSLATKLPAFIDQSNAYITGVTGNIQLQGNEFILTRPLIQFVEGIPSPIN